jgi:hypothetical protein
MNGKQFKNLLVDDIAAAIKAGLLPEYEYKVRVTAPRGFRAGHDVCIETWIASIPSVENVLTEIFNKHKKKMDVNFHGISEPTLKDEPCMTLDQRLEKWEHMIRYKIESFYRVNPAWARR